MKYALVLLPLWLASCSSAPKKDLASKPAEVSNPAPAVEAPAKAEASRAFEAHCKQGTDERVLSVAAKGTGCELNYTKFAKSSVAASSEVGTKHCEEVLAKIQKHLTASGFACK